MIVKAGLNEHLTGRLRYVDRTNWINDIVAHKTSVLQQEYKVWHAVTPNDIKLIWRDVPSVHITELGNDGRAETTDR